MLALMQLPCFVVIGCGMPKKQPLSVSAEACARYVNWGVRFSDLEAISGDLSGVSVLMVARLMVLETSLWDNRSTNVELSKKDCGGDYGEGCEKDRGAMASRITPVANIVALMASNVVNPT